MNLLKILSGILVLSVLTSIKPYENVKIQAKGHAHHTLKRTDSGFDADDRYEYEWTLKDGSHYSNVKPYPAKSPNPVSRTTSLATLNFELPTFSNDIGNINLNNLLDDGEPSYASIPGEEKENLKKRDAKHDALPDTPQLPPSRNVYERVPKHIAGRRQYEEAWDAIRPTMARQDSGVDSLYEQPATIVDGFIVPFAE